MEGCNIEDLNYLIKFLRKLRDLMKSNAKEDLDEFERFYYKIINLDLPELFSILTSDNLCPKFEVGGLTLPIEVPIDKFKLTTGKSGKYLEVIRRVNGIIGEYSLYEEPEAKLIICILYLYDILSRLDKVCKRNIVLVRKMAMDGNDLIKSRIDFLSRKIELSSRSINLLYNGSIFARSCPDFDLKKFYKFIKEFIDYIFGDGTSSIWKEQVQSSVGSINEILERDLI
jgi:hypothetical protein